MRQVDVDGRIYQVELYLHRDRRGWRVRVPEHSSKYIADADAGGAAAGLERARAARLQLLDGQTPPAQQYCALSTAERRDKRHSTGTPGIYLMHSGGRNGRTLQYHFGVLRPDGKRTIIYIGTERTWRQRYDGKLLQARALREHLVTGFRRVATANAPGASITP